MRDKGRIYIGLLAFLVLVTFPVWYSLVSGQESKPPEIVLPADESQCVADKEYMRIEHMQMLMDWRDEVVRDKDRIFTTADGRKFDKSLTRTCMECHSDKAEFCDRCHDYVGVTPYCWECHIEPKGGQ
jgi:hypothetical protein